MIEVITDIYLKSPINKSLEILFRFIRTRKWRLLSAGTNKEIASIVIPLKSFRLIYKISPKKGEYKPPIGTESFISKVVVKKVTAN